MTTYDPLISSLYAFIQSLAVPPLAPQLDFAFTLINRPAPHSRPKKRKEGNSSITLFFYGEALLYVGYAGKKSNARYLSHYYNPNSSPSNLAKKLLEGRLFAEGFSFDEKNVGSWIQSKCRRVDLLFPSSFSPQSLQKIKHSIIEELRPVL